MTGSKLSSLCIGCFCLLMLLSSGCKKDTLKGELMAFHERYQMEFYTYTQCFLCTKVYTGYASNLDYSSAIEFTPEGKVIFYFDNEERHKTAFRVVANDITEPSRLLLDIVSITRRITCVILSYPCSRSNPVSASRIYSVFYLRKFEIPSHLPAGLLA